MLRERFGDRVAAGSISHFQAYRAGRVQIVEATGSPVITFASETLTRAEVERAADVLRKARIDVRVAQNEKRVLWHKLARIAPLAAASAASSKTVGELRERSRVAAAARVGRRGDVRGGERGRRRSPRLDAVGDHRRDRGRNDAVCGARRRCWAALRARCDRRLGAPCSARLGVPCPVLADLAGAAGLK